MSNDQTAPKPTCEFAERRGNDRRKRDVPMPAGEDRRKGDRREGVNTFMMKDRPWWLQVQYADETSANESHIDLKPINRDEP